MSTGLDLQVGRNPVAEPVRTMSIETIEQDLDRKVSRKIRLSREGIARFRVFTPFLFDDGDHLAIVLKWQGARWVFSDEAHTRMRLAHDIDETERCQEIRQTIISSAASTFGIEDQGGALVLEVPEERFGDALFSFVQGLLKITDVAFLSRERVRCTFVEDFRALVSDVIPEVRRTFDWSDPGRDPHRMYTVDCRINGMPRPLLVHALTSDGRTRDATTALLQFEKWDSGFGPSPSSRIRRQSVARRWPGSAMYAESSSPAWSGTGSGSRAS